jgi:hypothetical protein
MYVREIQCEGVDWVELAQAMSNGRFCEHSNKPLCSLKSRELLAS